MGQNFSNAFLRKPAHKSGPPSHNGAPAPHKGGPVIPEVRSGAVPPAHNGSERRQSYTKIFRWRLPDGQTQAPVKVEIAGTFTSWAKLPLKRDSVTDAWHITLHHLQCARTHHYMLLVDGQPVRDKHCDGLAVPHGPQEERFQLMTDRGPRVLMLFAQSK